MKMNIGPTCSRRRIALGFAALLAFPVVPAFSAGKRSGGKPAVPEEFLGSIYKRYLGKSSAPGSGIPLADTQSMRSYFTAGLALLILWP
jgi:hypothetical protein